MTSEENLSLAVKRGKRRGIIPGKNKKRKKEFRELLALLELGLENRLENPIGKLSGGQRQAITLLMATAIRPKLLLLDEHTAALDPKTASKVIDLTQQVILKDNLTTLMVTHSMQQAVNLGDRIIMMHHGKVACDFRGEEKKRLKVNDLLALFDDLRRKDNIDPAIAELLREQFV